MIPVKLDSLRPGLPDGWLEKAQKAADEVKNAAPKDRSKTIKK